MKRKSIVFTIILTALGIMANIDGSLNFLNRFGISMGTIKVIIGIATIAINLILPIVAIWIFYRYSELKKNVAEYRLKIDAELKTQNDTWELNRRSIFETLMEIQQQQNFDEWLLKHIMLPTFFTDAENLKRLGLALYNSNAKVEQLEEYQVDSRIIDAVKLHRSEMEINAIKRKL
ncbi:MAG: hypothetical protein M0Q26_11965 [Chitinophagaceae bacterium]|nr:hypothetical protein [Chitinophagaceae bacterium]